MTLLRGLHPEIAPTVALLDRFVEMIQTRGDEQAQRRLDGWMADAEGAGVSELTACVTKLQQDVDVGHLANTSWFTRHFGDASGMDGTIGA